MEAAVLPASEMVASECEHKQTVELSTSYFLQIQEIPAHLLICRCCLFVAECHVKCTFHTKDLILHLYWHLWKLLLEFWMIQEKKNTTRVHMNKDIVCRTFSFSPYWVSLSPGEWRRQWGWKFSYVCPFNSGVPLLSLMEGEPGHRLQQ